MEDALAYKVRLLNYLAPTLRESDIIASEVRFNEGMNIADLVKISTHGLYAFEIKSLLDNTRRLSQQSNSYEQFFNFYTLVIPLSKERYYRKLVKRRTGLIGIDEDSCHIIRDPKHVRVSKISYARWLHNKTIKKNLSIKDNKEREVLLKLLCNNYNYNEIQDMAIYYLKERLIKRYELFIEELGLIVTSDDVKLLSQQNSII